MQRGAGLVFRATVMVRWAPWGCTMGNFPRLGWLVLVWMAAKTKLALQRKGLLLKTWSDLYRSFKLKNLACLFILSILNLPPRNIKSDLPFWSLFFSAWWIRKFVAVSWKISSKVYSKQLLSHIHWKVLIKDKQAVVNNPEKFFSSQVPSPDCEQMCEHYVLR